MMEVPASALSCCGDFCFWVGPTHSVKWEGGELASTQLSEGGSRPPRCVRRDPFAIQNISATGDGRPETWEGGQLASTKRSEGISLTGAPHRLKAD